MSEQVSLSAAFSVLAMAAFVLFGAPHVNDVPGRATDTAAFAPAPAFALLPGLVD